MCDSSSRLPNCSVEFGRAKLLDKDVIHRARRHQFFRRDLTFDAYHESRTGEGMPREQFFRHADIAPDFTRRILHLCFQGAELRYRKSELYVVMHLYLRHSRSCCMPMTTFAKVGVERTLRNKIGFEFSELFLENRLIHVAHRKPFFPHARLSFEGFQEIFGGVDDLKCDPILLPEMLLHVQFIVRPVDAADIDAAQLAGTTSCLQEIGDYR